METKYTDEVLEAIARCSGKACGECAASTFCYGNDIIKRYENIVKAYLEERRSRGPCVWDDAPVDAERAIVWCYAHGAVPVRISEYRRKIDIAKSYADRIRAGEDVEKVITEALERKKK